jgi:hypothetical protein
MKISEHIEVASIYQEPDNIVAVDPRPLPAIAPVIFGSQVV